MQGKAFTEEQLQTEVDKVLHALTDPSKDYPGIEWTLRVSALKNLQQLIATGVSAFESFPTQFGRLIRALGTQLQDTRSAVVKEAVGVIVTGVKTCRENFDEFISRLADPMFALVGSTTKLVADLGHKCILACLHCSTPWQLLPHIQSLQMSKNVQCRLKATTYVATVIEKYPFLLQTFEQKHPEILESLEGILTALTRDGAAEVKKGALACLSQYRQVLSERSKSVSRSVDSTSKRPSVTVVTSPRAQQPASKPFAKSPSKTPSDRSQTRNDSIETFTLYMNSLLAGKGNFEDLSVYETIRAAEAKAREMPPVVTGGRPEAVEQVLAIVSKCVDFASKLY